MGLKNNEGGNLSYLKFKDGKFYSNKDKETGYDSIEGFIKNFTIVDQDYKGDIDRKLVITITDEDGETYLLTTSLKTSYTTGLVSFLKNADLSEKLTLVGSSKTGEDGIVRNSILIKQEGVFLKGFYTKATPNGMPPMKELIVNKKKVWDKSEVLEFLESVIIDELLPKVSKKTFTPIPKASVSTEKVGQPAIVGEDDDDLPF